MNDALLKELDERLVEATEEAYAEEGYFGGPIAVVERLAVAKFLATTPLHFAFPTGVEAIDMIRCPFPKETDRATSDKEEFARDPYRCASCLNEVRAREEKHEQ